MQLHVFKLALVTAIAAAAIAGDVSTARADATCTSVVSPLMDWARGRSYRFARVEGTSVQKDNRWSSHSTAALRHDSATDRFIGELSTTFSDRAMLVTPVGCDDSTTDCEVYQGFWRKAADRTEIQIARDGTVTLRSITWGGGYVTLPTTCRDGYLMYFDGWSLTMLDLAQWEVPR